MYNMPTGYTFLPVGTPDLAERCQEISRKKDVPVNVVNVLVREDQLARVVQGPGGESHMVRVILTFPRRSPSAGMPLIPTTFLTISLASVTTSVRTLLTRLVSS